MRYNTKTFIEKAKQIHGDKYDYSKVEYINNSTKVCIICPEHGEFWIRPSHHINNGRTNQRGCPICGDIKRRQNTRKNTEWFITRSKEIYGNKYDYSKVVYKHTSEKVCIICPEHGEFWQRPNAHLHNHGCPKCGGNFKMTTETFIEKARKVHGDKYDYSKVKYVSGGKTKVCIICPKHGEFWQYSHLHLQGKGCPHCKQSSLEKEVRDFLDKESIKYVYQKRAKWLGKQSLDFYLPDYNIAIECQGIQHFTPSEYFGGEMRYEKTVALDKNKNKICSERGIKILYYTHYSYDYDYELITELKTLKDKIYGAISKNKHFVS